MPPPEEGRISIQISSGSRRREEADSLGNSGPRLLTSEATHGMDLSPALLAKIITDKNTSAKDKDHFMRSLDFIKGPEKDAALVEISTSALQ